MSSQANLLTCSVDAVHECFSHLENELLFELRASDQERTEYRHEFRLYIRHSGSHSYIRPITFLY